MNQIVFYVKLLIMEKNQFFWLLNRRYKEYLNEFYEMVKE